MWKAFPELRTRPQSLEVNLVRDAFCLLITFVLSSAVVCAQTTSVAQNKGPWLKDEERQRLEELRASGFTALFNLDYDKARRDFAEVARAFPEHPAGTQFLAAGLWIKTLYETRRLQATLYSSASFYAKEDDKVDPKIVTQFRAWTREAKRLAEARLKQNPKDVEALYYLGTNSGLKASFQGAVERRHFAALRDGSEAVDRHREVLKLDPNFRDAEITIGLYDYVVGSLPLPIKIIAGIAGSRGSKKRGLATLEWVAKDGKWLNDDAKTVLILLYTREKRFAEAAATARELSAKYPRNFLFKLEAADALVAEAARESKAGRSPAVANAEREAFAVFEELLHDRSTRDAAAKALDLIHFKHGEVLLTAGQAERAAREFLAATKVERGEPALVTMAHLYAARAYDLAGKRDDALAQYRQVLSRPDIYDAHDGARKGLLQPFKMEGLRNNGE